MVGADPQLDVLRARISFAASRGSDAPPLLLKAAKRLEPLDAVLARETYLDALYAAVVVHRLATGGGLVEVSEAARAARPSPQPPRAPDLLLDGWALDRQGLPECDADLEACVERVPKRVRLAG